MRVTIALDARQSPWDLMASIGHELRHTIEAIQDPTVRSNRSAVLSLRANRLHGDGLIPARPLRQGCR